MVRNTKSNVSGSKKTFLVLVVDQHKWTAQKAVDQQLSELNDEIETMKEEKRKMNAQLADVQAKDQEIEALEQEVKGLMKVKQKQNIFIPLIWITIMYLILDKWCCGWSDGLFLE